MAKEMIHPIIEGITNHINMNTSGALMITGYWGCGKTYFMKNEVIPQVKEKLHKEIIIVSLFGLNHVNEIPERVLYAYCNALDNSNSSFNWRTISNKVGLLLKNSPKLNEFVDLNKIFGKGEGLYNFISKDTIICFDDLERILNSIDVNEVLGAINQLVENLQYKVIVVANEDFIRQSSKNELIFKEKVVEKTLVFIPDTINTFKKIVSSYESEPFISYMFEKAVKLIEPENALHVKSESYRKNISNIRILKFAIEHFYCVFSYYANTYDINANDIKLKLNNYWAFILAVSIEYKLNNISFDDDKTLSKYVHNAIAKINLEENNEDIFFGEEIENTTSKEEQEHEENSKFQNTFYKRYFITQEEFPIFHPELYAFMTGAITPDYEKLDYDMDKALEKFIHSGNPAHELLNLFMKGIWGFSNNEVGAKLNNLFDFVSNGKLDDYMSYLNASSYLLHYKELYSKTDEEIIEGIKKGIDLFTNKIEITYFTRSNLQMLESHIHKSIRGIYDYIKTLIHQKEKEQDKKEQELVEQNFIKNIELVVKDCMCIPYGPTPKYMNYPILKHINKSVIINKINKAEPIDVYWIITLLHERYENGLPEMAKEEQPFLSNLKDAINQLNLDSSTLSNALIKSDLLPKIEKILGRLDQIR